MDYEPAGQGGRNYGWRVFEGTRQNSFRRPLPTSPADRSNLGDPRAVGQAITGGYVYRGAALGAAFQGRYFYGDCVQGQDLVVAAEHQPRDRRRGGRSEHADHRSRSAESSDASRRSRATRPASCTSWTSTARSVPRRGAHLQKSRAPAPRCQACRPDLAAAVQGGAVSLSWMAPATGGVPAGYIVEAGPDAGGGESRDRPRRPARGWLWAACPTDRTWCACAPPVPPAPARRRAT